MVYRGKPSRSCRQCRRRDIKCDKRRESCGQCIRAHLLCPGYHDQSKVIFNDETKSVVRKAQLQPPTRTSPEKLLAPCIETRAKELFVWRFVYCRTARFPYMEHFWQARPQHAHLGACVQAVSSSYMAFELCSPDILQRARQRYASALRLTQAALQCPETAKHNATLLTVILMDMYEKFSRHLVHDYSDVSDHLEGALALLQLSGASQFEDAISLRLFRQLSMRFLMNCLKSGDDVPPALLSFRQSIDAEDRDGKLEELTYRFVEMRAAMRKGELLECDIATEAQELDDTLVKICSRPPKWKFEDAFADRVDNKYFFIDLVEATA